MTDPRKWTAKELARDAAMAVERFRRERLEEPLERYTHFFNAFVPIFRRLVDDLATISAEDDLPEHLAGYVRNGDRRTAFRYLTAPPISEDDLKILAETKLSEKGLRRDATEARRVHDLVLHILDPHRFPWIAKGTDPTDHERDRAVVASAALVAARKVETERRSGAGRRQEGQVRELLRRIGYVEVPRREIPMLSAAPEPGEFCSESALGGTRADLVVRLRGGRIMAVECKSSNSAVNSYKRINHETVGKARNWLEGFGQHHTVPAAVIAGVFNPANLESAQAQGVFLFWSHRLGDLADFIGSA